MKLLRSLVLSFPFLGFPAVLGHSGSIQEGMEESMNNQREALARMRADFLGPSPSEPVKRQQSSSTITFSNPAAEQFFVDGTTIPEGQRSRIFHELRTVSTPFSS
jgi:hypothetical protein